MATTPSVDYTPDADVLLGEVHPVSLRCIATVWGQGDRARRGSREVIIAETSFLVTDCDVIAPQVSIQSSRDREPLIGRDFPVSILVSGGRYDTLAYAWSVESGDAQLSSTTAAAPTVRSNTPAPAVIRCVATARGTGVMAQANQEKMTEAVSFALFFQKCADTVRLTPPVPEPPDEPPPVDAPTLTIADIGTVPEDRTVMLPTTVSGGAYDSLSYAWEVVSGGGIIAGQSVGAYTSPAVDMDTDVTVRCTVTATGTGTFAQAGTDTAMAEESFIVKDNSAIAPMLSIRNIGSMLENRTVMLPAMVSGGRYDSLSYAWEVVSGGGIIAGTRVGAYTSPSVMEPLSVNIRCTVTAIGTGTIASAGTMDSVSADESFTVMMDPTMPPANITLAISGPVNVRRNMSANFIARVQGNYDAIDYQWRLVSGRGSLSSGPGQVGRYQADQFQVGHVTVECNVTARGTGENARAGSRAVVSDRHAFRVTV